MGIIRGNAVEATSFLGIDVPQGEFEIKVNMNQVTDLSGAFGAYLLLTSSLSVDGDYYNLLYSLEFIDFDTSKVTNMRNMFVNQILLESLDLSSFDTSNVTDMSNMFYRCTSLTTLDLSSFDTSKVTDMRNMFFGCSKLIQITCTQAFKDWCIAKQNTIGLPTAMCEGGSGTWVIID